MIAKVNYYIKLIHGYKFPIFLWFLAWSNINSGFWNIVLPDNFLSTVNAFRGLLPYIFSLFFVFFIQKAKNLKHRYNPVFWLSIYGCFALLASFFSPSFEPSLYFGLAFLMNLLIPNVFFASKFDRRSRPEIVLLISTWIILALFVIAIYIFIGDKFSAGYGIDAQLDEVTRTSGLTRWFGVSGLICFALIWQGKTIIRWFFLPPFAFCAWIVWSLQSRGGMFSFFAGILFLLVFSRSSWRAYLVMFLVFIGLFGLSQSEIVIEKVKAQIIRGQNSEEFYSLTGRTRSYENGLEQVKQNIIFGQGNWADRLTIGEHVHNSYLQALMNSGIIGFIPYLISWVTGWWLFYKLIGLRMLMLPLDRHLFLQTSAVMCFFTVRSIPETTTASFSVDSLIMVPVYIYLFVLYLRLRNFGKN